MTDTPELLEGVCARLEDHKAPAGVAPAGLARHLPGLGHPPMPPWQVAESGPDGVTMRGHFTRFHVGGNGAVHGGVIPLFYDWHFGMVVSAAGRQPDRLPARGLPQDHTDRPAVGVAGVD